MANKRISGWSGVAGAAIAIYGGAALGWWQRPNTTELLIIVGLFILDTLFTIGSLLERIAPPDYKDEESPP